ncbi:Dihydropyridine-sensitive L-type skeletal muscle calcium channel subunit alpha-1 [Symbiodinium microadriaticum]|uniref:Dihydropyridine-sensitive L-type skeletal muscle calcium channel subunit alpha-1 n=1 Tax=Symbiodinium microadriaticum TaxID=2951 RepID=A0A1Q9D552_SYMMI|nr:Dihydropyridine-sensitive L-type skeletal muscle calcium channel subunit alpha-1 [Symbiodinium microadriaticum]CAE7949040.1 Cacna1e [Symbiodinium sp. KB8]
MDLPRERSHNFSEDEKGATPEGQIADLVSAKVAFLLERNFMVWTQQTEKTARQLANQEDLLKEILYHCSTVEQELASMELFGSESDQAFPTELAEVDSVRARLQSPPMQGTADSSISPSPSIFNSYTQHDLGLRQDAQKVHSRMSAHPTELTVPHTPLAQRIVGHPAFDIFFGFVVMTNAVFLGVDVQRSITDPSPHVILKTMQYIYTLLFIAELAMRVAAGGLQFFISEDWLWALVDVVIVLGALLDVVLDILEAVQATGSEMLSGIDGVSSLKAFRIIRITRILKTVQVVRVFRFVMALRTLVTSIFHTLKALLWALILLFLIVYVFSVIFTSAVNEALSDPSHLLPAEANEQARRYFSSLYDTMLSLLMSIAGGVSWEEVIAPLRHVSEVWGVAFLVFFSFTYFAVLNVVTAVFCTTALESAQNDHATVVQSLLDNKETHLSKLRAVFSSLGATETGAITYTMFEEKINTPEIKGYLETLGLDVWDAWSFFKLLDTDGGGAIDIEEFFMGCLRFRGQASAMDVGKILQDQNWLITSQGKFQAHVEGELNTLKESMSTLLEQMTSSRSFRPASKKPTLMGRWKEL